MPKILKINPQNPEEDLIGQAVACLEKGGVVAFPTETFYGLAVDAANDAAIERLFQVKGRQFNNPIALIAGSQTKLSGLGIEASPHALRLMDKFWAGPLTLVFKAPPSMNQRLTAGTGKIGIRVSSHPIADRLADRLGRPITATSANPSGASECNSAEAVLASLKDRVDLVIDAGTTPGGRGSTFLDVSKDPPICLREGAIALSLLFGYIGTAGKK